MRTTIAVLSVLAWALLSPVFLASTSAAEGTSGHTSFVAYGFLCDQLPGQVRTTGSSLHIRNLTNIAEMVSDEPRVAGVSEVRVDVTINLQSGAGAFTGVIELRPHSYVGQGSWVGSFGGHLVGGRLDTDLLSRVDSHIVLRGTGALDGLKLIFDHHVVSGGTPPDGPAGCTFGGEVWSGVVADPQ